MSAINTDKILALLNDAPLSQEDSKMVFSKSMEESAIEMLNDDVAKRATVPAKEGVKVISRRPLPESVKKKVLSAEDINVNISDDDNNATHSRNGNSGTCANNNVAKEEDEVPVEAAEEQTPAEAFDLALRTYYEALVAENGVEEAENLLRNQMELILEDLLPKDEASQAEEAVAAECIHKDATEMIVETAKGSFPENFTFDEKAFAEEFGIEEGTISCIYKPEDPDAQIAECVEVSFDYEGAKITLTISADNTVEETVDAEKVDSQFTAEFTKDEDADGNVIDVLVLTLIDEEEEKGSDTAVKSEEDTLTKSEGDEKHTDETGASSTDEFIEEAGLDLDPYYSKNHGMKVADKSVHDVKAVESLAAKIIRTRK